MDYGGPPGQTRRGNLGPFARSGHRAATHGGWTKHQPEPGYFVHRSPLGYVYLVTNQGTLALGHTTFSNAPVWQPPYRNRQPSPPSYFKATLRGDRRSLQRMAQRVQSLTMAALRGRN